MTLDELRRYAVTRSLFPPTSLPKALEAFGFVQADPIRAPARAQDLTLRHRVTNYRAGDLERRYPRLQAHEDFFINYGFVTDRVFHLMHPRRGAAPCRVVRRDTGIRIYAVNEQISGPVPLKASTTRPDARERLDALVDVVVRLYAPLPAASLTSTVRRLRYAVPHWSAAITGALQRARHPLARATVDGVEWYWPAGEPPGAGEPDDTVRLLAPFDPVVWDRRRFELLWNWPYRFEAYTPVSKRRWGYYALPLLWRDRVIGWANASVAGRVLTISVGYVSGQAPRDRQFRRALQDECDRLRSFLGLADVGGLQA